MATLEKIRSGFQRAILSSHSSFYRDLYGHARSFPPEFPRTWDEWESLPLLSKNDIQSVPFHQRVFITETEMDVIRMTSGTTGKILTIPRNNIRPVPELDALLPYSRIMGFFYPHHIFGVYGRPNLVFVGGDSARLDASAVLAARAEIEIIFGLPSLLLAFAEILAQRYDIRRIRRLMLQSDICTKLQEKVLRVLYPSAELVCTYTSAEMQGQVAFSPTPRIPEHSLAILPTADYHFESIDEAGKPIREAFVSGELVTSALNESEAFPVLRYRTGDRALIISTHAEQNVFEILGRTAHDRVRFAGGHISINEIERAINVVSDGDVSDFEAVVSEEMRGNVPLLKLTITLITHDGAYSLHDKGVTEKIANELRINEIRTYADGVQRKLCAPLTCKIVPSQHNIDYKRRRLVDMRR